MIWRTYGGKRITPIEKNKSLRDIDRINTYRKHRNTVGEGILRAAMRALAIIDATDMVNDLLEEKFNLNGVRVDRKAIDSITAKVMSAEIANIIATNSTIEQKIARRMIGRIIAQSFPTKDNVLPPHSGSTPERLRIEDLESVIRREMQRTLPSQKR